MAPGRGQGQQTDGARTQDCHRLAGQVRSGQPGSVHGGRQRFDQRRLLIIEVLRHRYQPVGGDDKHIGQASGRRCASEEHHRRAQIVPAVQAVFAVSAGHDGLDDDALPDGDVDVRADRFDDTDDLVARVIRQRDERMPSVRGVHVRATDSNRAHPDGGLSHCGYRHRRIHQFHLSRRSDNYLANTH